MTSPFERLGVTPDAGDGEIRKSYLELVKQFPPDLYPEQFKSVNAAYEKIRTERKRIDFMLFSREPGIGRPAEAITGRLKRPGARRPPDFKCFMRYLKECADRMKHV